MTEQSFSKKFITGLLSEAKVTNEAGEIDKDYVERLAEQLDKKIGLFVMEKLSTEQLEVYFTMIEKKASPEELNKFFEEKIPNFSEQQKKFLDDYALDFFNRAAKIREALS